MAAHPATILIPDISGFTRFMKATNLEYSADILCELLNELIRVAEVHFSVAEIEGDAILFYIKKQKVPLDDIITYCLRAYQHFHAYLQKILPRLQGQAGYEEAADLSLKFIVHWGKVAEMNIANFKKPVGIELVKAHLLLKNALNAREYILITEEYASDQAIRCCCQTESYPIVWRRGQESYPVVGEIRYHYALLKGFQYAFNSDTLPLQAAPSESDSPGHAPVV